MRGIITYIKNCYLYRKILFSSDGIHYGWLLVYLKIKIEQDIKLAVTKKFYEKQVILDILNMLLKDVNELIDILNEEEKTSHIRSKDFKDKYKSFWTKYSTYSLEIYE